MEKEISRMEAVEMIKDTNGQFFGVTFIKRTTGEQREMNARLNVKKHLAGGERAYNFEEKGLIPCFDTQNGYRCIPLEGLLEVRVNKKTYKVVD